MTLFPVLERQYPLREAGKWMAASGEPHHVNVGVAVPPVCILALGNCKIVGRCCPPVYYVGGP